MANFTTTSCFLVNHENLHILQSKEIKSLTSPFLKAMKEMNVINEFYVKKNRLVSVSAAIDKGQGYCNWESKTKQQKQLNIHGSNSINVRVGSLGQEGLVYRENIRVRSFETGFDGKVSLAALTNYLQDTALNHAMVIGLLADGFGSTPEMSRHDLIWVISALKIVIERHPSWLDVVEVETWMYESGKNGLGRDWIVRDIETGNIMAQATSLSLLMNKKTRKLSKFPKEIKEEIAPFMMSSNLLTNKVAMKRLQFDATSADYTCSNLTPGWHDLDLNQHVNHVKYINWILESVPGSIVKNHKVSAIYLEYRKECDTGSVLQSLSRLVKNGMDMKMNNCSQIELEHLLLLENGSEILRGSTMWEPRQDDNFNTTAKTGIKHGKC